MESIIKDIRYGFRSLLKQPGFTAVAVITLALGIGANTTIFTVVNAVLLRPLPYENAERLVKLNAVNATAPLLGVRTSPLNFLDWRSQNQSFENLGGYQASTAFNLSGVGDPERISASRISDTLFPTLGIGPVLGRNFLPEEDQKGANNVVILSNALWVRRFNSNEQVLGENITLDGRSYTVVGVMPRDFAFPSPDTGLWIPFGSVYVDGGRGNFFVEVVGKLRSDVTPAQAQADMERIAVNLERLYPEVNSDARVTIAPLQEQVTRKIRPTLWMLLGVVGFVLLISCANVGNLLLARATSRQREIAVRCALGASRFAIIRQLITESALLALFGGLLGLLLAYWSVRGLVLISPEDIPRISEIGLDARVLVFTFTVSVITCLLFGLAPAWQASRPNLNEALQGGIRGSSTRGSFLRSALVVTEFALALVLLIGGGLMLRSFWRLLAVNPGFNTARILTFDISLPAARYGGDQGAQFFQQTLDRIANLPGVQSVGATTVLPLSKTNNGRYFTLEGRTGNSPRDYTLSGHRIVSSGYFKTLNVPLIKGRYLSDQDGANAVVVNQAFARIFMPNQDAIGKRLKMGETPESKFDWMTIVGVVQDVKHTSLEAEPAPELYRQFLDNKDAEKKMTFAVRSDLSPQSLIGAIRREIQNLDRDQPLANVFTMDQLIDRSVARWRFSVLLMSIFGISAVLLAAVGIYGVISYTVTQSTREIGIRMALGAQRQDVLKLVVGQGLMLILIGVAIGLAGAFGLTRLITTLLFGVTPTDLTTFAVVPTGLTLVALLACYIPAWRATRVDPLVALRYE
jgi:putative ABC transport system permease protein